MKLRRLNIAILLLATAIVLLAIRLAWRTSSTEVGWEALNQQWLEVVPNVVGAERQSLHELEPVEQARFWLAEVERLAPAQENAEMAVGGAWMLDAPGIGFINRHWQPSGVAPAQGRPVSLTRERDWVAISAAVDGFEQLSKDRCLELIDAAVRLEPDNAEWWRARGLLAFRVSLMDLELTPRRVDWLTVLNECRRHDPENALYDYLAALQLWTGSATYTQIDDGYVLSVTDQVQYDSGTQRFASAQRKPHLMFGSDSYAAALRFALDVPLEPEERVYAAARLIDTRASIVLAHLHRWQVVRQSIHQQEGNYALAAAAMRQALHVFDQVTRRGNHSYIGWYPVLWRSSALAFLMKLFNDEKAVFQDAEKQRTRESRQQARIQLGVLQEVGQRIRSADESSEVLAARLVAAGALQLTFILLATAGVVCAVSALVGRRIAAPAPRFGYVRHVLVWMACAGLTFWILGFLLPVQPWKEAAEAGLSVEEVEEALGLDSSDLLWGFLQWMTRDGVLIVPLLATAVLGIWAGLRAMRHLPAGSRTLRHAVRIGGNTAAGSNLVASGCLLVVYLAVAPIDVEASDRWYRRHTLRMSDPGAGWWELESQAAAVRGDADAMKRIVREAATQ